MFASIYAAQLVTSVFCNCLLLWFAVNITFLYPLVYKTKKDKIDGLCTKLTTIVKNGFSTLEKKIPKYQDKEKRN